jgi:hypothetical protein
MKKVAMPSIVVVALLALCVFVEAQEAEESPSDRASIVGCHGIHALRHPSFAPAIP